MKVDISHSQTLPTNDLLNLPDIDGVFNEVKDHLFHNPRKLHPKQCSPTSTSLMTVGSSSSSMHNNTATESRSTTAKTTR